jgi:hypothetical protein
VECSTTDWNLGSVCEPNPCPQPGACCIGDGTCVVTLEGGCVSSLWVEGATCGPNHCPGPPLPCEEFSRLRARCDDDGTVDVVVILDDLSHDGESIGIAINGSVRVVPIIGKLATHDECCPTGQITITLETPSNCLAPVTLFCGTDSVGACCRPDGTCTVTSSTSCGGVYQGDGTNCAPNLCPQPPVEGACCDTDGSCLITTEANCTGTYQGDDTTCVPDLCLEPTPTGACCDATGICEVTTATACSGTYSGDGTSCEPNLCPLPPIGTCCALDGSCAITTEADCTGTFTGDTFCDTDSCPLPPIGPTCIDIRRVRARCNADGTTDVLVVLEDTSHEGETVTVGINGLLRVVPIVGRLASHKECCPSGQVTVSLKVPGECMAPLVLECGL